MSERLWPSGLTGRAVGRWVFSARRWRPRSSRSTTGRALACGACCQDGRQFDATAAFPEGSPVSLRGWGRRLVRPHPGLAAAEAGRRPRRPRGVCPLLAGRSGRSRTRDVPAELWQFGYMPGQTIVIDAICAPVHTMDRQWWQAIIMPKSGNAGICRNRPAVEPRDDELHILQ